ncbi:hypothetical protein N7490_008486 [Penicillium lividum]|nr:hypothetical protein N7490_008486 [Penicillium lividum]
MAETCMRYLLADVDETDLCTFRLYLAEFWVYHFREANDYEQEKIEVLASSLCEVNSKIFRSWVEVWRQTSGESDEILNDPQSITLLMVASLLGLRPVVRRLLRSNDVDIENKGYNGMTPLLLAAKNGQEAVVKLLLDTGKVDVDIKDDCNRTPLFWAIYCGYEAVVKLLLDTGKVDVDIKDAEDQTPLSWAKKKGNEAILLECLFPPGALFV